MSEYCTEITPDGTHRLAAPPPSWTLTAGQEHDQDLLWAIRNTYRQLGRLDLAERMDRVIDDFGAWANVHRAVIDRDTAEAVQEWREFEQVYATPPRTLAETQARGGLVDVLRTNINAADQGGA